MDQRLDGRYPPARIGNLVAGPDAQHRHRTEHAAEDDEHGGNRGTPADTLPARRCRLLAAELGGLGAEAFQLGSLILAELVVLAHRSIVDAPAQAGHHPLQVIAAGWPSRILPVLGGPVLHPLAEAPLTPPPGKDPESPTVDLLHPAHVAAAGPPGEPLVEGIQAWVGVGQVMFHAVEDPQLTSAQAHDDMLPSGA